MNPIRDIKKNYDKKNFSFQIIKMNKDEFGTNIKKIYQTFQLKDKKTKRVSRKSLAKRSENGVTDARST